MGGGYDHRPEGEAGVAKILSGLQSQVNAIRSGAAIKSAVIQGDAGGRMYLADGQIALWDDYATYPDTYGLIYCDPISGLHYLRMFPPYSGEATGLENSFTLRGKSDETPGAAWVYTDGRFQVVADKFTVLTDSDTEIYADGRLDLVSNAFDTRMSWTSTGSAANMYQDSATGRLFRSTSALKYKADIADAEVDPVEVLALVGRTWADKGKIDDPEQPADLRRDVGFIAEELDMFPSLRQFIVYDEDGEPDSIEYDRLSVAMLAVLKDFATRFASLEERLDALEA